MPTSTPKESAYLTLEEIQSIDDRRPLDVVVPEWRGKRVKVRAMTLQQIATCNRRAANEKRGGEVNPEVRNGWYLVEGMLEPVITLDVAEAWLTERAAGPATRILGAILEASGLTDSAKDAAKSEASEGPA